MGIVEAMAAGTSVVAWKNGGPTVTVRNGQTGYLVEPYDTDRFAQRILDLATNPSLAERLGRAGHRRVKELFSYERHIRVLEESLLYAVQPHEFTAPDREIVAPVYPTVERMNQPAMASLVEQDDVVN